MKSFKFQINLTLPVLDAGVGELGPVHPDAFQLNKIFPRCGQGLGAEIPEVAAMAEGPEDFS